MKERSLYYQSEKLAKLLFGFLCLPHVNPYSDIHESQSLWELSVVQKEIIAKDAKRFHDFKDGIFSCRDCW
ncbi:Pentatricopeptide repeat-containing protein [Nymphaea thermarum]|nr:Pentatricopeptide repeat-containing protein [Nymphaea thermarum]